MDGIFIPFRFKVTLYSADKADGATAADTPSAARQESGGILCGGMFSEVSGLEATMAPRTIAEGGGTGASSSAAARRPSRPWC
jgi:hypothetical protein